MHRSGLLRLGKGKLGLCLIVAFEDDEYLPRFHNVTCTNLNPVDSGAGPPSHDDHTRRRLESRRACTPRAAGVEGDLTTGTRATLLPRQE